MISRSFEVVFNYLDLANFNLGLDLGLVSFNLGLDLGLASFNLGIDFDLEVIILLILRRLSLN